MAGLQWLDQLEWVKGLAGCNADLDSEGKAGMIPMALAAYAGQLDVVQALAGRNANLDAETKHSMTSGTAASGRDAEERSGSGCHQLQCCHQHCEMGSQWRWALQPLARMQ